MFDIGYILLGIAALLPVIASMIVFRLDNSLTDIIPYWARQTIIGIIFGGLAIVGTEWGINIGSAVVNCRDAAVLCAGLLFGGPAGIIAGVIGGVERFIAVAWGAGEYTQIACTIATIVAGIYAAIIRRYVLEGRRPEWAFAFMATLTIESFHMAMVFVTHINGMSEAFSVVLVCAPPMLIYNSISVMLATMAVSFLARGTLKRLSDEKTGILEILQGHLLASIILAFLLLFPLEYGIETAVAYTANEQYLTQNLSNVLQFNVSGSSSTSTENSAYFKIGSMGFLAVSDIETGTILSGPDTLAGKTTEQVGIANNEQVQQSGETDDSPVYSSMYEASISGTDYLCMDALSNGLRLTAAYPVEEAYLDRDRSIVLGTLVQIMLFAIAFILIDFFIKRRVIFQVRSLNDSLQKITDGNLDTAANARSNREFAQLSDGINTTVEALQRYTKEAEESIARELELAKTIQYSSLPSHFPPYPDRSEFDIFASMDAAKEVGGDFYDFYLTDENRLSFTIADVSGKGIPAALFMMRTKTQLKDLSAENATPASVLTEVNRNLCEDNESSMFVTAWQGNIELENGLIHFANAGHNSPVIRRGAHNFEFLEDKHNLALAALDDAIYAEQDIELQAGDIIFLYTDGLTEATNANEQLYGNARLLESLNHAVFDDMRGLCEAVKKDVDEFVNDAPQFDDITMLALQYRATPK